MRRVSCEIRKGGDTEECVIRETESTGKEVNMDCLKSTNMDINKSDTSITHKYIIKYTFFNNRKILYV